MSPCMTRRVVFVAQRCEILTAAHEFVRADCQMTKRHNPDITLTKALPSKLVHIHSYSQDVELQHHSTYNIGNHHN